MPQKRSNLLLWIILGGGAFIFFILCLIALAVYFSDESSPGLSLSGNQVAALELDGVISDSKEFVDQLKDYGNRYARRRHPHQQPRRRGRRLPGNLRSDKKIPRRVQKEGGGEHGIRRRLGRILCRVRSR